jgi:hypothetical protein
MNPHFTWFGIHIIYISIYIKNHILFIISLISIHLSLYPNNNKFNDEKPIDRIIAFLITEIGECDTPEYKHIPVLNLISVARRFEYIIKWSVQYVY